MRRTSKPSSAKSAASLIGAASRITGLMLALTLTGALSLSVANAEPDWSEGAGVPVGGRGNPYELSPADFIASANAGKIHAQVYPVSVTELLPPYEPFKVAANGETHNPLSDLLHELLGDFSKIHDFDDVLSAIGLHPYPAPEDTGVYAFPLPEPSLIQDHRVGFAAIPTAQGTGFTISCAACHSARLFGKTVLGMTNRFPRANEVFVGAKKMIPFVSSQMLAKHAGATPGEMQLYDRLREAMPYIGAVKPRTLGLDTSLSQVALSLARRGTDPYAEREPEFAHHPRPEPLRYEVADSKPAVWWNVKYKNRWLSDGSVVSGNPIYTNLLWNEIGRGVDLHSLESWFEKNQNVIAELTTAVFSSEAPRLTDFFPAERLSLPHAKSGQKIFEQRCAHCHGHYDKNWDLPDFRILPPAEQLATRRVRYKDDTEVKNVGTDPGRWKGMKSLEQLNGLAISKRIGTVIKPQEGYVPPPLVGIWARWPYLHNNSVPSLCALLTRHEKRPLYYAAVEAEVRDRDFDFDCVGYPTAPTGPIREVFDTTREGLRNTGHDEGIFLRNGRELLSDQDKRDLIEFLKTL